VGQVTPDVMLGVIDMFEWLKKKIKPEKKAHRVLPVVKAKAAEKSAKEIATSAGEPYIAILRLDIDPENLHQGAFELDWNDKFVADLVRAGYMMKPEDTDSQIVDRWFQNVCRHVVMETWEQEQAIKNSGVYVNTRDLGGGRTEIS